MALIDRRGDMIPDDWSYPDNEDATSELNAVVPLVSTAEPRPPTSCRAVPGRMDITRASTRNYRDELLNGEIFYTLKESKAVIEGWRRHYNTVRPHSSLGYMPPAPEAMPWPASQPGSASPATPPVAPRPIMN